MFLVCTSCAMGRLAGMGLSMDATGRDRRENSEEATSPPGDTEGTGFPDVDSVAEIVGEVSENQPSGPGRPVTEVARSALARVAPGAARASPGVGRAPPASGRNTVKRGTSITEHGRTISQRGRSIAGRGTRLAGRGVQAGTRWLASEVLALAPRLPVRDLATLRTQFPGKSQDELGNALIEGASRASAAIGATVGVWSVLPVAPAFPAEVVTETLTLVGIEIKLIAELHEVYGARPPGDLSSRMTAYVGAWAHRRGVALTPGGVVLAMGSPLGAGCSAVSPSGRAGAPSRSVPC